MKKLHLICNSHIDLVWMWDWEEGLGEGISTFRQAEAFTREFDFIFNHNEAILYEFIEEHAPKLFEAIREQVSAGKWHIMGGWYLQPDCNVPSGEAFVRQIILGRRYFAEKFGVRPTTALNFDSFGHSVGLVQILKKCGFDSYLFCRPMKEMVELPDKQFLWVGKDGSRVKAARAEDETIYCSGFGTALTDIRRKASAYSENEVGVALWGVGNHGGLPSRKDLNDVAAYMEASDYPVVHSTPEAFFAEIEPTAEYHGSLQPCLIGAYTSMQSIKCKHIELENFLFTTEKLCALAQLNGLYQKNAATFLAAEKALAMLEFHDISAGTCAADGEKSSLRKADAALEALQQEHNKAFFAIASQYPRAAQGEFPIFLFHSQPYDRRTVCETEFLMPKALISDTEQYTVTAYQNGKPLKTQCLKELSNIHYDRRKRIAYLCDLPAFAPARIDFRVEVTPKQFLAPTTGDEIVFSDRLKTLRISRRTGLLESFVFDGKELLSGGTFEPIVYDDNADPWGWYMDRIGQNPVPMRLSPCKRGPFAERTNVNIIEDGEVLTEVESFFENDASFVRLAYKMYRDLPYLDVCVDVLWNEQEKALKLRLPTACDGAFFGQIPFGTDTFPKDGTEITAHRFVGMENGDRALILYNNCTYGFSAEGRELYATLLRGAAYCAHPIEDRVLLDANRFTPYIEQGRHRFCFRLSCDSRIEAESHAQEFCNPPYSLCFFPDGNGSTIEQTLRLDDKAVAVSAFYAEEDGYILRLVHNGEGSRTVCLTLCGQTRQITFGAYEVKTFFFDGKTLTEREIWV